jgi:hypothetical protein
MMASCPNCGGDVEFRFDDSFVRVCGHCRNAVLRTDRGIDSLGQVADLVPIDSPLRLFAEGHYGSTGFLLVGMAQVRHSAGGLWQEWYAKLDGGRWGWLAEAQGRFYLTFEEPAASLPEYEQLAPGTTVELPVHGALRGFTVAEHTAGTYIAAAGELPFRLVPNGTFRYVDLDDGTGTFATIDYGDQDDAPTLYVGHQASLAELGITGGEVAPSREPRVGSKRLACPSCNAPIELVAPEHTQRVVCAYCNSLIDLAGDLRVLEKLAGKATPSIPLGSKGAFRDGDLTVIGYLQRSAEVEGSWYSFEEYLLYAPEVGFRWLVCSDLHWSYVQPVEGGAVANDVTHARYDGVKFRHFASAPLRVDLVLGELYWQVTVGETVQSEDFIAPPAMLSRETNATEETWSLSTYMTAAEVARAFASQDLVFTPCLGHAPNENNRAERAARVMAGGIGVLLVVGIVSAALAPDKLVYEHSVPINGVGSAASVATPTAGLTPGADDSCAEYRRVAAAIDACTDPMAASLRALVADAATASDPIMCSSGIDTVRELLASTSCNLSTASTNPSSGSVAGSASGSGVGSASGSGAGSASGEENANVFFSDPFELAGGRNVELAFDAPVDNDWAYVAADLVNQETNEVVGVEAAMEHWSGVDDGESWSEGSRQATELLGPQPAGKYLLRLESQHGTAGTTDVRVTVRQGVFRGRYLVWALAILGIPWLIVGLVAWSFEKKRWENGDDGKPPVNTFAVMIALISGVGLVIWLLLKAVTSGSRND